jgi:ABC-type molybdate transport system substrate-binding protein
MELYRQAETVKIVAVIVRSVLSEILPVTGAALGGELPSDIMPPTVIHAFIASGAKDVETAAVFLDFLRSPDATRIIEAKGMKPGSR